MTSINLRTLLLNNCNITTEDLTVICPALMFLNEVDLSENKEIGKNEFMELAETIEEAKEEAEKERKSMNLQTICLKNCRITGEKLCVISCSPLHKGSSSIRA